MEGSLLSWGVCFSFVFLFGDFYIRSYLSKGKAKASKSKDE